MRKPKAKGKNTRASCRRRQYDDERGQSTRGNKKIKPKAGLWHTNDVSTTTQVSAIHSREKRRRVHGKCKRVAHKRRQCNDGSALAIRGDEGKLLAPDRHADNVNERKCGIHMLKTRNKNQGQPVTKAACGTHWKEACRSLSGNKTK